MKKMFLFFAIFFAVCVPFNAFALNAGSTPIICANFAVWCELFGIEGVSGGDFHSMKLSDTLNVQSIDDFYVYYNSSTFEASAAMLDFIYTDCGDHQREKALAFFAAIEKGAPDLSNEVSIAKEKYLALDLSTSILDKMFAVYDAKNESIFNGDEVVFYYGENATFSLLLDDGVLLIVAM